MPPLYDFSLSYFIKFRDILTLAGQVGNTWSILKFIYGQRKANGFLKKLSAERAGKDTHLEQIPAKNAQGAANRALSFKRTFTGSIIRACRHFNGCCFQCYLFCALHLYLFIQTNIR